ncbi:ORF6N domain-containing protein [uncultured Bacteroides sp.]|uniref:ORF6N domain-containing protein n=1 Tax=uncultured Bacteroides sp. TaxID=162156 RepID=UPI002599A85A|nr:ORF6N domain-containing protein [uncultured Bacteroides sp.]
MEQEIIQKRIHEVRRFPSDFMFQLTKEKWANLKSQFVTSSWGGTRKLTFVFTEQGLAAVNSHQELEDFKNRIKTLEEISEENLSELNDLSEDSRREFDDIYLALSQLSQKKITQQQPIAYKAIQKRRNEQQS